MTRKDYIMLAAAIASAGVFYREGHEAKRIVAESIVDALVRDNPRLDRDRFLRDCGVQS